MIAVGKRKATAVMLLLAATALIGDGCWIRVKAVLAQALLQQAWQQTQTLGTPVKA